MSGALKTRRNRVAFFSMRTRVQYVRADPSQAVPALARGSSLDDKVLWKLMVWGYVGVCYDVDVAVEFHLRRPFV